MPNRFVILRHEVSDAVHFDLMLEVPGQEKLRTLQLAKWPLAPGESCPCTEIAPHRAEYLHYEGEVTGNRGTVTRVAEGTWTGDDAELTLDPPGVALEIHGASMTRRR
jgi:hypothetical protein